MCFSYIGWILFILNNCNAASDIIHYWEKTQLRANSNNSSTKVYLQLVSMHNVREVLVISVSKLSLNHSDHSDRILKRLKLNLAQFHFDCHSLPISQLPIVPVSKLHKHSRANYMSVSKINTMNTDEATRRVFGCVYLLYVLSTHVSRDTISLASKSSEASSLTRVDTALW